MKDQVVELIGGAVSQLLTDGVLTEGDIPTPQVDHTRDPSHGDLATNIAMVLAKRAGMAPRDLAAAIVERIPTNTVISRCDIAGPGFINFHISQASNIQIVEKILESGAHFGRTDDGAGKRVQVEFVSANPTGPLHVGHGRGAAIGDALCRLLDNAGWSVHSEFYYNDAGQQISNLALSVKARLDEIEPTDERWPKDGYQGDYIKEVARAYANCETVAAADRTIAASGNAEDLADIQAFSVAWLRREQDHDLKAFDVNFDCYFLESSLYTSDAVEHTVNTLIANGHTYELDDALWLRTTDFGDDKDRVMRKREGGYTYFVPDVAYHLNKWERGFERVINEQGADHHSTITRVRAGLQGLDKNIPDGWPDYVLHQMVTVMRDGEEVKLSKRAGSYVTLRDLIDEVGRDATRFFLTARAATSQLTFDIDLALSKSNENPVYYIQYAHARICSVQRKAAEQFDSWTPKSGLAHLDKLNQDEEQALALVLSKYPEVVAGATKRLEPHAVANYLRDVAAAFHSFYNAHKIIDDDVSLSLARLALAAATQQVIARGLHILGVSAPEAM
ncbi:arginine--tRNA ligase [Candidatus Paraluminiphilus aquimaris]|jgi:arginyl-tRNA synthetase|uniref:Arginine--tRNA ligase n=1 Tax=Candidatus Paraluminiphilus aquimaris TaxID=2518994 RepID=A0ABY6Q5E3_9GAMM|nr:arginine--tRNA ligase [Candidatus Paraluminiphilus aquimaris]UZP73882.1 arginine--tRNA ligase [Candidatus Paraluminiphilus aquimaris]